MNWWNHEKKQLNIILRLPADTVLDSFSPEVTFWGIIFSVIVSNLFYHAWCPHPFRITVKTSAWPSKGHSIVLGYKNHKWRWSLPINMSVNLLIGSASSLVLWKKCNNILSIIESRSQLQISLTMSGKRLATFETLKKFSQVILGWLQMVFLHTINILKVKGCTSTSEFGLGNSQSLILGIRVATLPD